MLMIRLRKKDSTIHIPSREIVRVEVMGDGSGTVTLRSESPVSVKDAMPVLDALRAEGEVHGPQSVFEAIFGK